MDWTGSQCRQVLLSAAAYDRAAQFIADKIAELGFNCVRLPWALDTVFEGGGASEEAESAF